MKPPDCSVTTLLDPNDETKELDLENASFDQLFAAATGEDANLPKHQREALTKRIDRVMAEEGGWQAFGQWFEKHYLKDENSVHLRLLNTTRVFDLFQSHQPIYETLWAIKDRDTFVTADGWELPAVRYSTQPMIRFNEMRIRGHYLLHRLVTRVRSSLERQIWADVVKMICSCSSETKELPTHMTGNVICHPHGYPVVIHQCSASPIISTMCPRNSLYFLGNGRNTGFISAQDAGVSEVVKDGKIMKFSMIVSADIQCGVRLKAETMRFTID